MKTNCLFCQIVQKQIPAHIVAEDNNCLAFLDINPASEGHTLLITKKHFANLNEVEEESWKYLLPLIKSIVSKLEAVFKTKNFNFITNMGEEAYQSVFHFHLHIIPKYEKNQGFIWTIRKEKPIDLVRVMKKLEALN